MTSTNRTLNSLPMQVGAVLGTAWLIYAFLFGFEPQTYAMYTGKKIRMSTFVEYVDSTVVRFGDHWYVKTAAGLAYPGAVAGGAFRNGLISIKGG